MWYAMKIPLLKSYKYFGGKNSGEIEQHLYTLRGKVISFIMDECVVLLVNLSYFKQKNLFNNSFLCKVEWVAMRGK